MGKIKAGEIHEKCIGILAEVDPLLEGCTPLVTGDLSDQNVYWCKVEDLGSNKCRVISVEKVELIEDVAMQYALMGAA